MLRFLINFLVSVVLIPPLTMSGAQASDFYREDLRIPFAAAGPDGLEAMLIRPAAGQRYPLALITPGSPRDPAERKSLSPYKFYAQALEFARRGFAALVLMRRGYGASEGTNTATGTCGQRDYVTEAKDVTADLKAAIDAMAARDDVTLQGMIAVGESSGGFATIALTANNPPPGLVAAINFAGGRGSRADNDVCQEDQLVSAFGTLGKTSRVATLWIYARNDLYFEPTLAWRFYRAFANEGGQAEFISANPFGKDGHTLFSNGIPVWMPVIDKFLREHELGAHEPMDLPKPVVLKPPPQLISSGRQGFMDYLASPPHKAFAVSPKGEFTSVSRARSAEDARRNALVACAKYSSACTIYATDDKLEADGTAAK
jgi:dienelactone hydrolase